MPTSPQPSSSGSACPVDGAMTQADGRQSTATYSDSEKILETGKKAVACLFDGCCTQTGLIIEPW